MIDESRLVPASVPSPAPTVFSASDPQAFLRARRAELVARQAEPFACDPALQAEIEEVYARLRPLNARRQAEVEAYDRELERMDGEIGEIDAALGELDGIAAELGRIAAAEKAFTQRRRELLAKFGG